MLSSSDQRAGWAWSLAVRASLAVVPVLMLSGTSAGGQTAPAQNGAGGPYTLHVYTDLLQIPTIALTHLHGNYNALTAQRFTIRLDNGPGFHPVHIRPEGDDPISLAILLDMTDGRTKVIQTFADAVSSLPAGDLSARDSIAVYTYGCELKRTTEYLPATPDPMKESMTLAFADSGERNGENSTDLCGSYKRLWDVIARVAEDVGEMPGRRVVLVVSDGSDRNSVNTWRDVERFAGSKSITVFGMREPSEITGHFRRSRSDTGFIMQVEDPFGMLCGSSGGLVFDDGPSTELTRKQFERFVAILRNRYILEFPRPSNGAAGLYDLTVKVGHADAIVRPSGIAFPPRASEQAKEPGVLPQDESKMPVVGQRHILTQPQ